jgi:hypothetical protein
VLPHIADLSESLSAVLASERFQAEVFSKVIFKVARFLKQEATVLFFAHVYLELFVGGLVLNGKHPEAVGRKVGKCLLGLLSRAFSEQVLNLVGQHLLQVLLLLVAQ